MVAIAKSLAVLAASASAAHDIYSPFKVFNDVESICGKDGSTPAPCIKNNDTVKYTLSQAVARLNLADGYYCSGFLWGSEGHLLTNNHCIEDDEQAKLAKFEFEAECKTCEDPANNRQLGCRGNFAANSSTLIATDYDLDFTLVKLNLNPGASIAKYGYLQARETPAKLNEPVWITGHPNIKPKRISFLNDDGKPARITNSSTPSQCAESDTYGYNVDTEGGSSGSPILSAEDNKVVALHNCGGCTASSGQNTGNKIHRIIDYLKAKKLLPKDAVAGGSC